VVFNPLCIKYHSDLQGAPLILLPSTDL
jgi:hypothetical protein